MKIIKTEISKIDKIRPLWEELNEYIESLHRKYFRETLGITWKQFRNRAITGKAKFDIIKDNKKIVGYCISIINKLLEGEIVSIYILPEFRSKGIGTHLIKEHLKWLKENKVKSIFLYVHPCNIDAIRLYWRFNFFSNSPLMEVCTAGFGRIGNESL